MSNPAIEVQDYGQSLWLDYIHRQDLESGELQRRIAQDGILGVTSNPSIFQSAIGEGASYDAAIAEMLDTDAMTVYETLAIQDIQQACDLFRPVYERTQGKDGYVSLEVAPQLARDSEQTFAEAQRLFTAVDRPNVMIKIPGTSEGIPAIEKAIAAGINVNVTLLFSVADYRQVAEAYIRGLEQRAAEGKPIDQVASVASFFLSRIDTAVDSILKNNMLAARFHHNTEDMAANADLSGQAAIASAKLAYRAFQELFSGERWQALAAQGATVQRPLWASTSTKDPAYSNTRYVDELIGEDTVNTLPPQTLAAFIDHGTVRASLVNDSDHFFDPQTVMDRLARTGVDMVQVTHRLQVDGVEAFIEAFETLLMQIEAKQTVIRTGVMDRQKLALGIYAEVVHKKIKQIDNAYVNERLWNKDGSLWTTYNPDINKITNRLGWLTVLETIDMPRLQALQATIKTETWTNVVLLGMGGSSLAADVLWRVFGQQSNFPMLTVLDSTDPVRIQQVREAIDIEHTLFIVASKSGTTLETLALYRYFWQESSKRGEQFIAITDADSELAQLATDNHFRELFLNPSDIGGRYSALSYFGMVPAALMGLDLKALWQSATDMIEASHENIPGQFHPGISLGVVIGEIGAKGRDKLTIYSTQSLRAFGDWAEQLVAESLGKEGRSIVPVVGEQIATPARYASDRLFIYLRVDDDPDVDEMDRQVRALREAGHPRITLRVPTRYSIAAEFFRWQFATAIAGHCMGINPFDEPNVSEAKQATQKMLDHYITHNKFSEQTPRISGERSKLYIDDQTVAPLRELCYSHGYDPDSRTEVLAAQIAGTHAGDFFALLVYFTPDETALALLDDLRHRLRAVTKRSVTIGYGPRYLHSTGQLHKGGGHEGIYFQLTTPLSHDIAIPETDYSFGTLFQAQAAGDLLTLQQHARRVIRIDNADTENMLQKLLDAVQFVADRKF